MKGAQLVEAHIAVTDMWFLYPGQDTLTWPDIHFSVFLAEPSFNFIGRVLGYYQDLLILLLGLCKMTSVGFLVLNSGALQI